MEKDELYHIYLCRPQVVLKVGSWDWCMINTWLSVSDLSFALRQLESCGAWRIGIVVFLPRITHIMHT